MSTLNERKIYIYKNCQGAVAGFEAVFISLTGSFATSWAQGLSH